MAEISDKTQFDRDSLEALKALSKTLGQMNLYKLGHPAVSATLATAFELLTGTLARTEGELAYSIDVDKLVANGRIVGSIESLPSAITTVFNRFKLNSLTFKTGLPTAELAVFCELAASRPDSISGDPQEYLVGKGVAHIVFAEALYTKSGEEGLNRALEQKSLEETIRALVSNSVSNQKQYSKVVTKVMELLQEDIQKRVEEVVAPLRTEKNILQNEQARTQTVLENMAEGVVVVDEQGKVLMMNPAAEEIYGTKLAEVAGHPLAERAGEQHVVSLASEISTPGDRAIKTDVSVQGVEDTKRTVKASSALVQNEAGKVVGMVSTLTDVSKQKELQKMEREFVAHVTHELRAPLSSIKAALDILTEEFHGKMQEDEERMLRAAVTNSDRLENLINGILDFSKIEAGQMTVYPKPTNAEAIGREAVESLKAWAIRKKLNLSLSAEADVPEVVADHGRTVQVLINLISNAIKFTPAGGSITIKIARAQGTREKWLQYSVTDTGSGIPASEHKKVFEKFVQIASGEMHVGGTGLGLSIAKALVHLQGGKMWLESEAGKGATFSFTLPYVVPVGAAPISAPAEKKPWWKEFLGLD